MDIDIMNVVDAKILRWYGHMQRMWKSRWPQKILKLLSQRNRKHGRPRKTWKGIYKRRRKNEIFKRNIGKIKERGDGGCGESSK